MLTTACLFLLVFVISFLLSSLTTEAIPGTRIDLMNDMAALVSLVFGTAAAIMGILILVFWINS